MNGADPHDFLNLASAWNDFAISNDIDEYLDPDECKNLRAVFCAGAYASLMILDNIQTKHQDHQEAREILTEALIREAHTLVQDIVDA